MWNNCLLLFPVGWLKIEPCYKSKGTIDHVVLTQISAVRHETPPGQEPRDTTRSRATRHHQVKFATRHHQVRGETRTGDLKLPHWNTTLKFSPNEEGSWASSAIKGMGNIKLPLSVEQADVLKTKCTAAPYGRGSQTLVNMIVRDARTVMPRTIKRGRSPSSPGLNQMLNS